MGRGIWRPLLPQKNGVLQPIAPDIPIGPLTRRITVISTLQFDEGLNIWPHSITIDTIIIEQGVSNWGYKGFVYLQYIVFEWFCHHLNKLLIIAIDFHSMDYGKKLYYGSQWLPTTDHEHSSKYFLLWST